MQSFDVAMDSEGDVTIFHHAAILKSAKAMGREDACTVGTV